MRNVYQQHSNGARYVISAGHLGRQVGLDGARYFTLEPAGAVVDRLSGLPVAWGERENNEKDAYALLNESHALRLIVSQKELEEHFAIQAGWTSLGNSPIHELMAQYTQERCDFTDALWVANASQRLVASMPDSQVRCLLHALSAKALDAMSTAPPV